VLAWFVVFVVYGLPFPMSISETATIPHVSDYLLPLCLGALALFALTYSIRYSYNNILDKIFPAIMFVGFLLVAVQQCASPYLTANRTGLFYLTPEWSHIVHCIGAIAGFGAMILHIMLCFTKSDKTLKRQTAQKRIRNDIYKFIAYCMIASLIIFILDLFGVFGDNFPVVYVVEWVMLGFGGVAYAIKGGIGFKDRRRA
jgi:small-conductance mechanosensitive channel